MIYKQNPFSLYDFLGYFIPGILTIYLTLMVGCLCSPITSSYVEDVFLRHHGLKDFDFYLLFIVVSYVTGHFVSYVSDIFVEKYSRWRFGYPSKYLLGLPIRGYFDVGDKENKIAARCWRAIVVFILAPVSLLDWIFNDRLGVRELYIKKLDDNLISRIKRSIEKHFGFNNNDKKRNLEDVSEGDFFRLAYHYALEHSRNHVLKFQNYVALFGFLRTVVIIMVLEFWICANCLFISLSFYTESSVRTLIVSLILFAVLGYFFFLAFTKFYRKFSLEVLMAFTVIFEAKEERMDCNCDNRMRKS